MDQQVMLPGAGRNQRHVTGLPVPTRCNQPTGGQQRQEVIDCGLSQPVWRNIRGRAANGLERGKDQSDAVQPRRRIPAAQPEWCADERLRRLGQLSALTVHDELVG
jgi:hypothetical protein